MFIISDSFYYNYIFDKRYPCIVTWDDKLDNFVGMCPNIPTILCYGPTEKGVRFSIYAAIAQETRNKKFLILNYYEHIRLQLWCIFWKYYYLIAAKCGKTITL